MRSTLTPFAFLLAVAVGLLGTAPLPTSAAPAVAEITLLHDTHLRGDFGDDDLNLAHYAALVHRLRAERPNALFLGGGDDTASSTLSALFRGKHMIDALNAAGLDVNTYGNRDFDYGPDNLADLVGQSAFRWVSANVLDRESQDAFAAERGAARFVILEAGGVKVGVTGIAPADTATSSRPGPGIEVLDPEEALRSVVPQMRAAGADIVVVLSHEMWTVTESLAQSVPGIDVFVGDHGEQLLTNPQSIGDAIVSRVGFGYNYLGELGLQIADGKVVDWTFALHDVSELVAAGALDPDPTVERIIAQYEREAARVAQQAIGHTAVALDARLESVRAEETALGNFFADALRQWADADAALVNGGGLRGDRVFEPGPITRADVLTIMPFENFAVKLRLTGSQLLQALEHGVSGVEEFEGRFPQVSGVAFVFDPDQPPGSRIVEASVGGEALDPDAWYTLATYDFLADGGSGYAMFAEAERLIPADAGQLVSDIVIEAISQAGTIGPVIEGRMMRAETAAER